MDDLERELSELNREIAGFLLEAVRTDPTGVIGAKLEQALAAALKPLLAPALEPLRQATETVGARAEQIQAGVAGLDNAVAAARSELAQVKGGVAWLTHTAQTYAGSQPTAPEAASAAPAAAETDGDQGRRRRRRDEGQAGERSTAVAMPAAVETFQSAILTDNNTSAAPRRRSPASGALGLARRWWREAGLVALSLVIAVPLCILLIDYMRGYSIVLKPPAVAEGAPPVQNAQAVATEKAWRQVVDHAYRLPTDESKRALKALCGDAADPAACAFDSRWWQGHLDAAQQQQAFAYTLKALQDEDGCPTLEAAPPAPATAGQPAGGGQASVKPPPLKEIWACLLWESGRQ